ncbi:MAG: hypothetical protein M3336_03110 [Chloroflexota bacterium]|nr:hypothetical protein [Chloroflexota bacterium]
MATDYTPRMSNQEHFGYLVRGAAAQTAQEVHQLRTELIERWRGDPRAAALAETLDAHAEALAARETLRRGEASRAGSRLESRAERRTA